MSEDSGQTAYTVLPHSMWLGTRSSSTSCEVSPSFHFLALPETWQFRILSVTTSPLSGRYCTEANKQKIFRFNPGKTLKLFPPQHPYYKTPAASQKAIEQTARYEYGKLQAKELTAWHKENLPETKVGKFTANRFEVEMPDGQQIFVTKTFYKECITHHVDDELYVARLIYARMAHLMLPKATLIGQEPGNDHPDATFDVYQFNGDSKYVIELKVKRNADGLFLYYMRLYKK